MYFLLVAESLLIAFVLLLVSCEEYPKGISGAFKRLKTEYKSNPKAMILFYLILFVTILGVSTFLYLILNPVGKVILLLVYLGVIPFLLNFFRYEDKEKFKLYIFPDGRIESDQFGEEELKKISLLIKKERLVEELFPEKDRIAIMVKVFCNSLIPFCLIGRKVVFYAIGKYGERRKIVCVDEACEPYKKIEKLLKSFV